MIGYTAIVRIFPY